MGIMDRINGKMDDNSMRDRFEQLKSQEQAGELDDKGRMELNQLRDKFEHKDN